MVLCGTVLFFLGTQFGQFSEHEKEIYLYAAIMIWGSCTLIAIVRHMTFPRRLAKAQRAVEQLTEEERDVLVEQARSKMQQKLREHEELELSWVSEFQRRHPMLFRVLVGIFLFHLFVFIFVVVGDVYRWRVVSGIEDFWRIGVGEIRLAHMGLVLSLPGAFLLFLSMPRVTGKLARHRTQSYYELVHENHSGEAVGGLSLAQDVEEGALSVADDNPT